MQDILELYRDRLRDLSKRNASLRLLKIAHKNHCDVCSLDMDNTMEVSSRIAQELMKQKQQIVMISTSGQSKEELVINRHLTTLKREIDLIEQETGANTFHIAYGFLEGTLIEDFYLRSPVLLYPAHLLKKKLNGVLHWVIEMDPDNPPFVNPVLIMALDRFLGISLEDSLQFVGQEIPDQNVLAWIQSLLSNANIKVTIEHDPIVVPFTPLPSAEIPSDPTPFHVKPFMIFGKFRQSNSNLLVDYEELIKNPPTNGLLFKLLSVEQDDDQMEEVHTEILNDQKETETFFVLDTDASQEAAVIASRDREGLIVHGPPGTGKSQVIVNLVADRLARGQRVLVVCQKPVALEVVYNRLASIQLHHQITLVHDVNRDKASVYGKMGSILERLTPSGSMDLERMSNEMDLLANNLNTIARALHSNRPFERTLWYLYAHAKWDSNLIISVSDLALNMNYNTVMERILEIRSVLVLMQKYDHTHYPFSKRTTFATFGNQDHMMLEEITQNLSMSAGRAYAIRMGFDFPYTHGFMLQNKAVLDDLKSAIELAKKTNISRDVCLFYAEEDSGESVANRLRNIKKSVQTIATSLDHLHHLGAPITHFTVADATAWLHTVDKYLGLSRNLSRFIIGQWYSLKKVMHEYCTKHGVPFDIVSIQKHRGTVESFIHYESLREKFAHISFYSDLPTENAFEDWENWLRKKQIALKFIEPYAEAQEVFSAWLPVLHTKEQLVRITGSAFTDQLEAYQEITELTSHMNGEIERLKRFLQLGVIKELYEMVNEGLYDLKRVEEFKHSAHDFDSLQSLDQMKAALDGINSKLISRCQQKVPLESTPSVVEMWSEIIENSFLHAWIDVVEKEEPIVAEVSTELFEQHRRRYAKLIKEKRQLVPQWIDQKLAIKVPSVRGTARSTLRHEAGKKKQLKPLRRVMQEYTEDVLTLVPCWLCTPEAVSAIFPSVSGLFDLVIFDEASQCPVENGIPAIYRAKQVVVAGDEKQLPPNNLFRVSDEEEYEDDEQDDFVRDTQKRALHLLDWCKPKMADQWLTWHYRSAHDALINFSNYAFYGKRMKTAPIVDFGKEKPIEFLRVDGKWLNRTNPVEAEKIVDLVIEVLQKNVQSPTLGIITFNSDQAELIQDVLDRRANEDPTLQDLIERARSRKDGDQFVGLFVKNIENVQGDERDIIMFSVAYAKDQDGKMVSQFGFLSKEMGENRLNVAITRARLKVYIVCSFEPSEWTRVETYTLGPRLLKRYLEYAKAVSDGDESRVNTVLEGILDATAVQSIENTPIYDSPFEEEVANALRQMGYQVQTQVGFSGYRIDLAIVHPDDQQRFILGVECDGAMYHSSRVARERDLYRQRFLEQQGWSIHRIWSRNWWKNREIELGKVQKEVERLRNGSRAVVKELRTAR